MRTRRAILQTLASIAAVSVANKRASAALAEDGKTWCLQEYLHFDRLMAPWVVQRFIDQNAKFTFAAKIEEIPKGAIALGFKSGEFSQLDANGTCFHKLVVKYKLLDDPAIAVMDRLNGQAVRWYLQNEPIDVNDRYARWGFGLFGLADAIQRRARREHWSHQEILDHGVPLFDMLYDQVVFELEKAAGKKS